MAGPAATASSFTWPYLPRPLLSVPFPTATHPTDDGRDPAGEKLRCRRFQEAALADLSLSLTITAAFVAVVSPSGPTHSS